jgi:hypothetical protein
MGAAEEERTEVLVLRAWVEDSGNPSLRVRITRMTRPIQGARVEQVSSASATVDGVCATVRAWLEQLVDGPRPWSPPDRAVSAGQADEGRDSGP